MEIDTVTVLIMMSRPSIRPNRRDGIVEAIVERTPLIHPMNPSFVIPSIVWWLSCREKGRA
jgi:hypothetical protein